MAEMTDKELKDAELLSEVMLMAHIDANSLPSGSQFSGLPIEVLRQRWAEKRTKKELED